MVWGGGGGAAPAPPKFLWGWLRPLTNFPLLLQVFWCPPMSPNPHPGPTYIHIYTGFQFTDLVNPSLLWKASERLMQMTAPQLGDGEKAASSSGHTMYVDLNV